MEIKSNGKMTFRRVLYVYLGVCVLLVCMILFDAFNHTGGNVLQGDLYVKPNIVLEGEK